MIQIFLMNLRKKFENQFKIFRKTYPLVTQNEPPLNFEVHQSFPCLRNKWMKKSPTCNLFLSQINDSDEWKRKADRHFSQRWHWHVRLINQFISFISIQKLNNYFSNRIKKICIVYLCHFIYSTGFALFLKCKYNC